MRGGRRFSDKGHARQKRNIYPKQAFSRQVSQENAMDRVQPSRTRGGDPDGARVPPKDKYEGKQEKLLQDELDDSFPASDPPSITQPAKPEPPAPKKRIPD
jgi:hypothetical protein